MTPPPRTAPVNPEVLKWARESCGYTLERASERLKIATSELDAIESGSIEPRLGLFTRMSKVYRRSQGVLLSPEPPQTEDLPTDFRTFEGVPARLSPGALFSIREIRALQRFITRLTELERELLPVPQIPRFHHSNSPEHVGESERLRFGVSAEAQYQSKSNANAFRAWRTKLHEFGIFVAVRSVDLSDFRGFSFQSQSVPMITVSSKDSQAGRSFTLFHEYGHLLLGEQGTCVPGSVASEKIPSEAWCNRFSAAFLMPEAAVKQRAESLFPGKAPGDWDQQSVHVIATYFRVSDFVSALRLGRTGISDVYDWIRDDLYALDYKPTGGGGSGETRVEKRARENGTAIISAVFEGVRSNVVDAGEAAEVLKISSDQFAALSDLVVQHQQLYRF